MPDWRWKFSVRLAVFCGVIVKESDLHSRKTQPLGVTFTSSGRFGGLVLQAFGGLVLPAGFHPCLHPHTASSFPCRSFPPSTEPPERVPGLCQGMDELHSRLSLEATASSSANCRTCPHNPCKAFLSLEPPWCSLQLRCCLISSTVAINIYKP